MADDSVSPATCAELRRAVNRSDGLVDLATQYDLDVSVVARHVRGRCDHGVDEPAAPIE